MLPSGLEAAAAPPHTLDRPSNFCVTVLGFLAGYHGPRNRLWKQGACANGTMTFAITINHSLYLKEQNQYQRRDAPACSTPTSTSPLPLPRRRSRRSLLPRIRARLDRRIHHPVPANNRSRANDDIPPLCIAQRVSLNPR